MARLLFKEGSFRILSDDVGGLLPQEMNELIKMAGCTSHQTREKTKKTPEEFIEMIWEIKHYSVLEHSWFSFFLSPFSQTTLKRIGFDLLKANGLFQVTAEQDFLLISGNARIFNEAYSKVIRKKMEGRGLIETLLYELHKENPVLFHQPEIGFEESNSFKFYRHRLTRSPLIIKRDDILTHRAMTVEFNNHSRGFTHEDVRSRNGDEKITSYTQASTRYVDFAKGQVDLEKFQIKFILPYNNIFDFNQKVNLEVKGMNYSFTAQEFVDLVEGWYRALRARGLRPEEARQWLPIGIESQIVQTYNLREWLHWFYLRTGQAAHPEIRWSAVNLLKEVQRRIPGIFDDFEFGVKKDGSEYAIYTGNELI